MKKWRLQEGMCYTLNQLPSKIIKNTSIWSLEKRYWWTIYRAGIETLTWRMDLWGKERVGRTESSTETYPLPCVKSCWDKQIWNESSIPITLLCTRQGGNRTWLHTQPGAQRPRGVGWGRWQGRREEIHVYLWLIHSAAWQKLIHYNASILQLIKYKIKII